jgi:Recombination endonuclease VII
MRWKRHGQLESTRPKDWGAREKHPLYGLWCSIRRNRLDELCKEWRKDFWAFVAEIKKRPADGFRPFLERKDQTKLLGPGNWFWGEPKHSAAEYEDVREYQRERQRRMRAADPDYFRNKDLQRMYGVTLEWYEAKLKEQNGRCAICKRKENTEINGKVVRLAVDHCHRGGDARGLLCARCNRGIGMLGHSKKRMLAAVEYLQRFD